MPIAYELASDTYYGLGIVTHAFQKGQPLPGKRAEKGMCYFADGIYCRDFDCEPDLAGRHRTSLDIFGPFTRLQAPSRFG